MLIDVIGIILWVKKIFYVYKGHEKLHENRSKPKFKPKCVKMFIYQIFIITWNLGEQISTLLLSQL
jgi:hypothetical protein